ncbi:ladderlectin-like, partial [Xiphophorus maculatus]|uniref:ladderlectin-like n=1 Tax=Xiphophorus maculatus TaxID=8083 RepID=UPI000C6DB97A
ICLPSEQADLLQRSLSCPSGWTLINSRCFQYVQKSMTWARAERNCLSMGANLASVQDLNEYNQIQIIVTAAGHGAKQAWIGGTNAQEVFIWLWSDGSRFDYTHWCSGQNNNDGGNQRCLQINYSGAKCWDDLGSNHNLPSVCAKKP